jgi:hypothetical protein
VDFREKQKYQEIHPVKLAIDISTALISIYFFWLQNLILGLTIGFLPSIIITAIIVKWVNLKKYKQSPFGKYIDKYMTSTIRLIRTMGFIAALAGAWYIFGGSFSWVY